MFHFIAIQTMTKFVPVYEYAKKYDTSKQNVYRWIREGKFNVSDLTEEEVVSKRIRINIECQPQGIKSAADKSD